MINLDKLNRERKLWIYSQQRPGVDAQGNPWLKPDGTIDIERQDNELFEYVRFMWGITFPRKAHCPGCDAPFKVFADCYYGRYPLVILKGARGCGKGIRLDSMVLTQTGYTEMRNISVGSKVIDEYGNIVNVIGVYPQGKVPTYKVSFNDGTSTITDGPHLWKVRTKDKISKGPKKGQLRGWRVKSTEDLKADLTTGKRGDLKWRIPIVEPIKFPHADLPIDPYALGLLLGDGSIACKNINYACHENDKELVNALNIKMANLNVCFKQSNYCNQSYYTIKLNSSKKKLLIPILKDLNLFGTDSHTKFIPTSYKYASVEQRLALLQGLMDTDGHAVDRGEAAGGADYITASKQLCEDVKWLVQSLGGTAVESIKTCKAYPNNHYYRLRIKMMDCPFKLKRKVLIWKTPTSYPVTRLITNIEYVGEAETQCIRVDSPSSTFIVNDCIVTHNSVLLATLALTEQVSLGTEVNILGASEEQSLRILRYLNNNDPKTAGMFWDCKNAPTSLKVPNQERQAISKLTNGGQLVCLTASPRNVRGRHPTKLRIDEVDEADKNLIDSALGCPQDDTKRNIPQNVLMASTHQHADGTLTAYIKWAKEINNAAGEIVIPIYKYCFHDVLTTNGGFMDPKEIEKKRLMIPEYMFRTEYLNGDPSVENSIFDEADIDYMFDKNMGSFDGVVKEGFIEPTGLSDEDLEILESEYSYYLGADWAKKVDSTVFTVMARCPDESGPDILVGWQRLQKTNYPDQIEKFKALKAKYPGPSAHDGAGPGEVIDDYLDDNSEPVNFSQIKLRNKIMNDLILAIQQRKIKAPYIEWMYEHFKYATYDQFFGKDHLPDSIASMALAWYARDNNTFDFNMFTC